MLQVPLYFIAQVLGSLLASGTLYLLLEIDDESYFGTKPAGGHVQSLIFELIATFLLMFVVSAVSTDRRAVSILFPFILFLLPFKPNHFFIIHFFFFFFFQLTNNTLIFISRSAINM